MKPGEDPNSLSFSGAFGRNRAGSGEVTASVETLRAANQQALDDATNALKDVPAPSGTSLQHQPQTYRLFGSWMNSTVTYENSSVAWLSADSLMSRVSSTVYQKFAGGGYLGGVKLVRGYDAGKAKEPGADKTPSTPTSAATKGSNMPPALQLDERQQRLLKRRSAPPSTSRPVPDPEDQATAAMSSLGDEDVEAEAVRRRDEKEIQNDYNDRDGENQGREIEHLILVTHGIGQRLGMRSVSKPILTCRAVLTIVSRTESVNFSKAHSHTYFLFSSMRSEIREPEEACTRIYLGGLASRLISPFSRGTQIAAMVFITLAKVEHLSGLGGARILLFWV